MLTIHHLGISHSEAIVWLCEELEVPYAFERYDRDAQTRLAPPEYKALHWTGMAPTIVDGDVVLSESAAVVEYICMRHGQGRLIRRPEDDDYATYLFWFHFANGSLMPQRMFDLAIAMVGGAGDNVLFKSSQTRSDRTFAKIDEHLSRSRYFAGDAFTAADILMIFPLTTMRIFAPRDFSPYPHLLDYLKRIGERPAYRRAMAKSDPDLNPKLT